MLQYLTMLVTIVMISSFTSVSNAQVGYYEVYYHKDGDVRTMPIIVDPLHPKPQYPPVTLPLPIDPKIPPISVPFRPSIPTLPILIKPSFGN